MSTDLIDRELEELLRETRPEPTLLWTETLDRRVAAGFREEPRAKRRGNWVWQLPVFGTVASLLVVAVLVSDVNMGSDGEGAGTAGGGVAHSVAPVAPESDADLGAATGGAVQDEAAQSTAAGSAPAAAKAAPAASAPLLPQARARKVVQSAQLTLTERPSRIDDVADGIVRVTDRLGGYVATSNVSSSRRSGSGYFELKVPVGRLDRALAELSKLAHVASRSQATEDITGSYDSARARLRELRVARASLLRQLARADTANETASLRAQLRIVRGQLAAATAQLERVNRRAAYATVAVSLESRAGSAAPGDDDGKWSPGDALEDAVRVLEVALGVALVALAVAVPVGLVALAGALTARWAGRRRRERALDAA